MAARTPIKSSVEKKTSETQTNVILEVANVETEAAEVNVVPVSQSHRATEQDKPTAGQVEASDENKFSSKATVVAYTQISSTQEQETTKHDGPNEVSECAAAAASQSVSEVVDLSQRSSRLETSCRQYRTQNRSAIDVNEPSTSQMPMNSITNIDVVDLTAGSDDDEDQRQENLYEESLRRIRELGCLFIAVGQLRRNMWPWMPMLPPQFDMLPFENRAPLQTEPLNLVITYTIEDENSNNSNDLDQPDPPI